MVVSPEEADGQAVRCSDQISQTRVVKIERYPMNERPKLGGG